MWEDEAPPRRPPDDPPAGPFLAVDRATGVPRLLIRDGRAFGLVPVGDHLAIRLLGGTDLFLVALTLLR
jgi:hypothetical protein